MAVRKNGVGASALFSDRILSHTLPPYSNCNGYGSFHNHGPLHGWLVVFSDSRSALQVIQNGSTRHTGLFCNNFCFGFICGRRLFAFAGFHPMSTFPEMKRLTKESIGVQQFRQVADPTFLKISRRGAFGDWLLFLHLSRLYYMLARLLERGHPRL